MTGLVRKATLLGVCGLFAAASAWAFVPDPAHSTCPDWIFVSGKASPATGGTVPHPYCDNLALTTVVVNDVNSLPINNCTVRIEINCCDINLCDSSMVCNLNGCTEVHNTCQTLTGTTGPDGKVTFCIWGYAKDPGSQQVPPFAVLCDPGTAGHHCLYGGCGLHGARIVANSGTGDVELCTPTAVVNDLNGGAATVFSNGPTALDVSVMKNNVGARQLPQPLHYRGRADQNCDGDNTGIDITGMLVKAGRGTLFGLKCPGQGPGQKTCSGKAPCANLDLP